MTEKTLIHFGAGNIGRGFVAPLSTAGGWRVVFVDIDQPRIDALRTAGAYTVLEVTNDGENPVTVTPVDGIMATDGEAVASAIAEADLVSTAVGLGALRFLGPNLAAGLAARLAAGRGPLDILVCENGIQAPDMLRDAIAEHVAEDIDLSAQLGLVRTSIGRMIPPPSGDDALLDIRVEPYAKLPLERCGFRGTPPSDVPAIVLKDDFDLVLRQKLYLHNCTHACLAYAGARKGYATTPACMDDPEIVASVRAAGREAAEALAREHGNDAPAQAAIRDECRAMLEELLERYRNIALGDPVARVGRDPWRKLAGDDRLPGPARLAAAHGVTPTALAHAILDACEWPITDDEPRAEEWRTLAAIDAASGSSTGWRELLARAADLSPQEPLMSTLDIAARQREAADIIRNAGIALKDSEVGDIEIADFGLGRYEEIGLAILVYCNTKRCCAKELAMLPGMMCPEHLHPAIDDQPGKEETFRVRAGEMHLFLPGNGDQATAETYLPADKRDSVTVYKQFTLGVGDQITLAPNTKHWFVAGPEGCVVSEFSTRSADDADIFTDPEIQRVPEHGPHNG